MAQHLVVKNNDLLINANFEDNQITNMYTLANAHVAPYPTLWYREQEMDASNIGIIKISQNTMYDILNEFNITFPITTLNNLGDCYISIVCELLDNPLYISYHTYTYDKINTNKQNTNIPNTFTDFPGKMFDINNPKSGRTFTYNIIADELLFDNQNIAMNLDKGLVKNKIVKGYVQIHDSRFSPPHSLHFMTNDNNDFKGIVVNSVCNVEHSTISIKNTNIFLILPKNMAYKSNEDYEKYLLNKNNYKNKNILHSIICNSFIAKKQNYSHSIINYLDGKQDNEITECNICSLFNRLYVFDIWSSAAKNNDLIKLGFYHGLENQQFTINYTRGLIYTYDMKYRLTIINDTLRISDKNSNLQYWTFINCGFYSYIRNNITTKYLACSEELKLSDNIKMYNGSNIILTDKPYPWYIMKKKRLQIGGMSYNKKYKLI